MGRIEIAAAAAVEVVDGGVVLILAAVLWRTGRNSSQAQCLVYFGRGIDCSVLTVLENCCAEDNSNSRSHCRGNSR